MKRIKVILFFIFAAGVLAAGLLASCSRPFSTPTALPPTATSTTAPVPTPSPTPTPTPVPPPTVTPLPGARIAEAEEALLVGDYQAAQTAFELAIANSTDSEIIAAGLTGLGRLYAQKGDTYNALLNLRAVAERFPDSPQRAEAEFYTAQVYEDLDRLLDAATAYQNFLARQPGLIDAYVHERLGDIFAELGDPPAALQAYLSAFASPRLPGDLSLEIKIARLYAQTGDHSTALVMYEDLAARTSSDFTKAQLAYQSGLSYRMLGMEDKALEAFALTVDNYPTAYDSYLALVELVDAGVSVDELQRGVVDYFAGQYTIGLAALDRYLAGSPLDPARALYYRGMTLYALNEIEPAVTTLSKVVADYPGTSHWARACDELAYLYWAELDQHNNAIQTYIGCVDAVPFEARAAEFLYAAGRIAERNDQLDDAAMLWERTASDYPQSDYAAQGLFNAGIIRYRQGDYLGAQAIFLRAHQGATRPDRQSAALMWAGKTFAALDNPESALGAWNQAAAIDPTGYYSERARELISGRAPFSTPVAFDLGADLAQEQAEAETWLRQTFPIQDASASLAGLAGLANDERILRGQAFWQLGLYNEATLEFDNLRAAYQDDPLAMYRLAVYFTDLGGYRHAILSARQVLTLAGMDDAATLNAPRYFNRLRFATPYRAIVIQVATDYGVHPLLVWSIMRQESFFDAAIQSSAGARGLMQIMPATGQDIARRMGWPAGYTLADLNRPYINIRMGVDYLSDMRTFLDYDLYAALAAYNGGPGNALIWKEIGGSDPDLLLEVIRLSEPARYIRGIFEMYGIYRRLYERTP